MIMASLQTQFTLGLSNIEPSPDDRKNAPKAHEQVRDALEDNPTILGWGVDPILIGSYKRHVSIRRIKDVDVFGRLHDLPCDITPTNALNRFEQALTEAFPPLGSNSRVKRQSRSVQVAFPEYGGLYVDAVPARRHITSSGLDVWEVPTREDDTWQVTNPDELTRLTSEMNDHRHTDGAYVRTVKLLRQTRRTLMGKKKPSGLIVEIAAFHAFNSGHVDGASNAEWYVAALRETARVLRAAFVEGYGLDDPTLPGEQIRLGSTTADQLRLAERFSRAAEEAQQALERTETEVCGAAKAFRDLLGKAVDDSGDTGFVFPMPDYCNVDGTRKAFTGVTAGEPRIPAGDRRFG
jgi:Second Messenger Oligonucleotide or Dinucleotide Synthetase domain